MSEVQLTVFFEDPFWVGIWERSEDGQLSVCKHTFGAEPTDRAVWEFILRHYTSLRFTSPSPATQRQTPDNPKRRQRAAKRQLQAAGVGTKAQQALSAQREQQKAAGKQRGKAEKERQRQQQFDRKQQKRREKHKGH